MNKLFSNVLQVVSGGFIAFVILLVSTTSAQAQTETYFFHTDHLGTPQAVTDVNQEVVWQAEYEPFGEVVETVALVEQNLRFPGQYFDEESGLHYNYFRDYDPSTGRYVESDPIGLWGGLNTYTYILNNPLGGYDPFGLWTLPQGFVDFSAGLGDALLLGFGDDLRELTGASGAVDMCSAAFSAGSWAAFGLGGLRLAYAGLAKGFSVVATSGAAVSSFRESLRRGFRFNLVPKWRPPNVSKYDTDLALRRGAGRTNWKANVYGLGVATAAATNANRCECQ